jgi:hypothetical protein
MFSKNLSFFFLVLLCFKLEAQIVNIENLRLNEDSARWSGAEAFSFSIFRNTNRLISASNNTVLQYKNQRHLALFLNRLDFSFSEQDDFARSGFLHFRYAFTQNDWLAWEAFTQLQSDRPLRIEQRRLLGVGPRFSIIQKAQTDVHGGLAMMWEYDRELANEIVHRDARWSTYLSANFNWSEHSRATLMVYYQPRADKWRDYRLSGQAQLRFKIWQKLLFQVTGMLNYDAFPVVDPSIPKLTYRLTNGLEIQF